MKSWLRAKSDLRFIQEFQRDALRVLEIENRVAGDLGNDLGFEAPADRQAIIQQEASRNPEYQRVRQQVARGLNRAIQIARNNRVAIDMHAYPPPAVGGPVVPVNLFRAILQDTSPEGVNQQWIRDALNATVGAAEDRARQEFWHLINPVYWVVSLLVFVLRIPFMLIQASGFDVSKVEDHLLARIFKLAELLLIIYLLLKLGIGQEQLREFLIKLVTR